MPRDDCFAALKREGDMGDLIFDPLAIAALIGFASLLLISVGIFVWVALKATKSSNDR